MPNPVILPNLAKIPSQVKSLIVFDFDSTLFKSPLPNKKLWSKSLLGKIISDCQWFLEERTLTDPFIPKIPTEDWWNLDLVAKARENLQDPTKLTVLLTGRRRSIFYSRIKELCEQQGLFFDLLLLKESVDDFCTTMDFKQSCLKCILDNYPEIKFIQLYDDRVQHTKLFETTFRSWMSRGIIDSFEIEVVELQEEEVLTMQEDLERELVLELVNSCNSRIQTYKSPIMLRVNTVKDKLPLNLGGQHARRRSSISQFRSEITLAEVVEFTGVFLDNESKEKLMKLYPCPEGWTIHSDHMTICLGSCEESVLAGLGGMKSSHKLVATHYGKLEGQVNALRVQGILWQDLIRVPHITLHVSPNASPKLSNNIVDWVSLESPITLSGLLDQRKTTGLRKEVTPVQSPQEVSVGSLVKKYFPDLHGKDIGKVVNHVNEWMKKTFVMNASSNRAEIEWFIESINIEQVLDPNNKT